MIKVKKVAKWVDPGLQLLLSQPGPHSCTSPKEDPEILRAILVDMGFKAMQEFLDSLNEESPWFMVERTIRGGAG